MQTLVDSPVRMINEVRHTLLIGVIVISSTGMVDLREVKGSFHTAYGNCWVKELLHRWR